MLVAIFEIDFDGVGVRITIGDAAMNDRFLAAIEPLDPPS